MAYQCPRCGDPVQRAYSDSAQMAAGLVGALFYAAVWDLSSAEIVGRFRVVSSRPVYKSKWVCGLCS